MSSRVTFYALIHTPSRRCYVGSTERSLKDRISQHWSLFRTFNTIEDDEYKRRIYCSAMKLLAEDEGDLEWRELEEIPDCTPEHRFTCEGEWMLDMASREFSVVNDRFAHGTSADNETYKSLHRESLSRNMLEWQRANRDKCRAYNKKSREKHKEEISAKYRERYNNDPEFRAKKRAADNAREARKREERDAARGPRVEPDLPPEEIERRRKVTEKSKKWQAENRERHLAQRRERRARLRELKAAAAAGVASASQPPKPGLDLARINANTIASKFPDWILTMRGVVLFYTGTRMTSQQVLAQMIESCARFGTDDFCSVASHDSEMVVLLSINPPIERSKRFVSGRERFKLSDGTVPSHFRLISQTPYSVSRIRRALQNCPDVAERGTAPPDKIDSSRVSLSLGFTIYRVVDADGRQIVGYTKAPVDQVDVILQRNYEQFKSGNGPHCSYYDIMDGQGWRIETVEELPVDSDVATIKAKVAVLNAGLELTDDEIRRHRDAMAQVQQQPEPAPVRELPPALDEPKEPAWNIARVKANTSPAIQPNTIASVRGVLLFYQGTTTTPAQATEYFKTRYARFGLDDYCISASFGAELFVLLAINPPIDAAKRLVATVADMALPDGTLPSQFRLINPIPESVGRLRKALQECLNSVEAGTVPPDKIESSRKRRAAGIEDIPPNKVITIFKIFHAESGTQYIGSTRTIFRKYMQIVQGNYNQFKAGKVRHCSYYDIMDKPGWQFVSLEELPVDTDVATVKARIAALEGRSS